jgi:uncharacterized membrane protein (UPF0127 family)
VQTITFDTPAQQALGLQWLPNIGDDVLYKFPRIGPGAVFHSNNVPEPFEIAFFSSEGYLQGIVLMTPPGDVAVAPPRTSYVIEAKPGVIQKALNGRKP